MSTLPSPAAAPALPAPAGPTPWPAHYALLDGLRGLAALVVVLHHMGVVEWGHYAVMVFFVISGYCITASAHSCLRQGLSFGAFMARRVRRIYPPYLLALLFFAATRLAKLALGDHSGAPHTPLEWVQNLTLTQWLSLLWHPAAEAAQNPTLLVAAFWSLNYEEQFYLLLGLALLLARRRGVAMAVPLGLLAVVGLAWNLALPDGWVCGLFIEYWLHFALGAGLFLVLCLPAWLPWRRRFAAAVGVLAALALWRLAAAALAGADVQRFYAELAVVSLFTLALLALRPHSARIAGAWAWRPVAALGTISYSLYLVHQFNLTLTARLAGLLLPAAAPQVVVTGVVLALHLGVAAAFWVGCERPFLNRAGARGVA